MEIINAHTVESHTSSVDNVMYVIVTPLYPMLDLDFQYVVVTDVISNVRTL